jgi:hypothetical protein
MSATQAGSQRSAPWKVLHKIKHFPEKNGVKIAKIVSVETDPNTGKDFLRAEESPKGGTTKTIIITLGPEDEAILGLRLLERAKQRPYVEQGQQDL